MMEEEMNLLKEEMETEMKKENTLKGERIKIMLKMSDMVEETKGLLYEKLVEDLQNICSSFLELRVNYTVGPRSQPRLPVQSAVLKIDENDPGSGHFGACLAPRDERSLSRFVSDRVIMVLAHHKKYVCHDGALYKWYLLVKPFANSYVKFSILILTGIMVLLSGYDMIESLSLWTLVSLLGTDSSIFLGGYDVLISSSTL
ncbi:hypothetical protein Tco_1068435 [Tanacetum coccineum]|uniref:Uncharacterized protein n=1 Tax=Tanacetum coccineum TaxID=301880 RepID=A0ABQ5HFQ0_9ASTR